MARSGTDEIIPDAAASSGLWMRLRSEFLAKQVPRAFPLFLQGSSRCACNPCCLPCQLVLCQSVPYVLTRQWFFASHFDIFCVPCDVNVMTILLLHLGFCPCEAMQGIAMCQPE